MRKNILIFLLLFGVVSVGVWRFVAIPKPIEPYLDKETEITMEATGYLQPSLYGFQADVSFMGVPGIVYFSEETPVEPGNLLTGTFRLTRLSVTRSNRFFKATPYTEEGSSDLSVEEGGGNRYWPARLCRAVQEKVSLLFDGDAEAFLQGAFTGDKSKFSDALTQDLFTTGMSHLAAVSGLHVSMLVGFFVLVIGNRRWAALVALPIIFVYVAMTGFTPSAIRAGIMVSLNLLAPLFRREYNAMTALIAAFILLCWYNPYMVLEPALQLSFTATLGLIVFAPKWKKALLLRFQGKRENRIFQKAVLYLCSAAAASCAALVFSVPVAAYWFGGVSILSPLCNLLLMSLFSILFLLGALCIMVSFLWMPAAQLLAVPAELLANAFRYCIALFGKIPYTVIYTSQPFLIAWLLFVYGLFILFLITRRWKPPLCVALGGFILCFSLTLWSDRRFRLEITVLDVGQGACVMIRSSGQTAVIDCGGAPSSGMRLTRLLQSKGLRQVDCLLLTHYDDDHRNGIPPLLENVRVDKIIGPAMEEMPEEFLVESMTSGGLYNIGEAEIHIVPVDWLGRSSNDDGLVFLLTLDGFSMLITGDLDASGERWLTRYLELPQNGLLLAGHHGSAGSSSEMLLDVLQPQAAIISSGENNGFGHPAPQTLERMAAGDIAVYRTDNSGNIVIKVP